ncbi:MAG: LPS-assembly protein LptD, partial [Halomonas sp.]
TCPPGEELWWLHAGTLELDHEAGVGRAHHARLEIGGIPWLYTPYLQFPIDDRPHTGVLPPSFGQSESDGTRLAVPVYVRLAPNYDLTLTPTYYSRRGLQLAAEGRYLHRSQEGELEVSYLPDDEAYAERLRERGEAGTEADRWALSWRHDGDLPAGIDYRLDVERVGDKDHLRDFSSDLAGSSDAELESRALAHQSLGNHRWEAEAQHWQNLRPESRSDPYRRWPAVRYTHTPGPLAGGVHYTLEGEAVHFDLPQGAEGSGDDERPTGRRYHLQPRLAWPVQEQAFFVEPAVSLHHTEYDLTRPAGSPRTERLSRTVQIASLDAGLFLERPFTLGSRPLLQTLEPRLFYLYAPHREQSAFPNFDTSERGNTVAQLFQENRFSGIDRIGDAHQVTAALTTRVLDIAEAAEPLRASIGQVYHLDDREVTLSGDPADDQRLTRGRSDLFADAQAQLPGGLRLRGEYRYDPYREARAATTFDADWQYRPAAGALVNLGYRLREETTTEDGERVIETTQELVEASTAVPLNERWRAVGAWQRSLLEPSTLELVGGVEYRQCCWAARGLFRRYRRGAEQQIENTFMVEFELTGLGRLGQDTAAFLRDVVPDYGKTVF